MRRLLQELPHLTLLALDDVIERGVLEPRLHLQDLRRNGDGRQLVLVLVLVLLLVLVQRDNCSVNDCNRSRPDTGGHDAAVVVFVALVFIVDC